MLPLWNSVLGWLLSIIAVAGNGIVIYLIVTRQQLHTTANWVILSLAIADFFLGSSFFVAEYLCDALSACQPRLLYVIGSFLAATSATNLCLMTLDRYIAIVKPLKYVTFMTTRRVVLLISIAWLAAFLPHFIYLLRFFVLPTPEDTNDVREFIIFDLVVFEILPLVILSLASGHIFLIARRHSRQTAILMVQLRFNQRINIQQESSQSRETSSVKVVGTSVTAFLICYLYELFYTGFYELHLEKEPNLFLKFNGLLYIVNSAANPVAYAFFKSDIKKSLRSMFRCRRGTPQIRSRTFP